MKHAHVGAVKNTKNAVVSKEEKGSGCTKV